MTEHQSVVAARVIWRGVLSSCSSGRRRCPVPTRPGLCLCLCLSSSPALLGFVLSALEDSRNPARGDGHRPTRLTRPHRNSPSSAGAGGAAQRRPRPARRRRRRHRPGGCGRGDRSARQAARRRCRRRAEEAGRRHRRRGREAGGGGHAQVLRAAVVAVPRRHEVRIGGGRLLRWN